MRKTLFALVAVAALMPVSFAISSSIQATLERFGYHLEKFNVGMATALMSNLDVASNAGTTCVTAAQVTSVEVYKLLDFNGYLSGGFNIGTFLESTNVVMMKLMYQYEKCGVSELFILWDTIMSSISQACGMATNAIIMIGTGYTNRDTAPYKSYAIWTTAYQYFDWEKFG